MTHPDNLVRTAGRELHLVRSFAAPRPVLFDAWTNPELIVRWMCPDQFTVVAAEVEPRQGGAWRTRMKGPAGEEMSHHGIYQEFTPPDRLVFTHIWTGAHPNPDLGTVITIDFAERGDRTLMTFHQAPFTTQEDCDDHAQGWSQAIDHLELVVPRGDQGTRNG